MKILSAYLGIVLLCSGFVIAENVYATTLTDGNEWELRKDKNGIKVYTRTNTNSGIVEYKAETTAKTEISKLIKVVNDVENYPDWMANCESASVFNKINDSIRTDYLKTKVPWPMDDRDIVLEYRIVNNTEYYYSAIMNSVPDVIPEKDNIVRIKEAKGVWVFKKKDKYSVEIIYQFYGDPEGNIPSWIINMFIVIGPYETLLNLKKQCNLKE